MYKEVSKLILYRDLGENSILFRLAQVFEDFEEGTVHPADLTARIYVEMKRLLDLSTSYGFDHNLWHNYLTFVMITNENSFTLTSEKVGANEGSVNHFAMNDFAIFKALFDYDFSEIERELSIDCFSTISNYKAIVKKERMYNYNVSEKVRALSKRLEQCRDAEGFFTAVTDFYADYGVGMFGLNKAFRIRKVEERVERFSVMRAQLAIERSDVCLIMIDAREGVTEQDTKIAGLAHEAGKASVVVVNKWDLVEKETGTMEKMRKEVLRNLSFMSYVPVLFISAHHAPRRIGLKPEAAGQGRQCRGKAVAVAGVVPERLKG